MHLKRLKIPKTWKLRKKEKKFIIVSRGPHPRKLSLPLLVILRDILKLAHTKKEINKILSQENVHVDNRIVKDPKFSVGLFDRIYIKKLENAFTVYLKPNGLEVKPINKENLDKKPCRIIGKTVVNKAKIQLNLHDGKNIITSKEFKVGDSVLLNIKENIYKIIEHLKLEKGSTVLVIKGRYSGHLAKISKLNSKAVISILTSKENHEVPKENVFVVNEDEFK